MALDSSQVSQMVGMYQGMAMNQMAYSQQIGMTPPPGFGQRSGGYGDQMMGNAMNAASAIGSPMMSAMGTLAPMGISAGLGLGAAASTGIGIPIAAGVAGAQYAGGQMFNGAQQQQALNQSLRSSFSFQNQQGGQGFNRSDMTQIGGMVRSMSEQFGPGQTASFGELGQIASKMGTMGLTQGVRDVQEFSKKFKETVTALKTMAKDLGTTLEGAMEFAQSAKGSGIFGMQNAAQFTTAARGTAVAGGLAVSEVTGMANIGSQISRSIGGLGRQGAMAGMKTIGQIGVAQQMGILSEEDIYNVTGQTGAEGRQAYAASSMQKAGGFLQSGRGRRMLASMADKDGGLDPTGAMMMMSGGMGVGETMSMDKQRLGSVGRANFIRNEGRLRGQALQQFGAFLPGMQMMQWAQSKGVDINNMDDRSMLFAQRQLGMGRDEADQAIKMAQNMPRIMEEMRSKQGLDQINQERATQRKQLGVEGIKNRLEHAREKVQNTLQKVGQDFFNEGSEMVDNFISKLSGDYEKEYSESAVQAYQAASRGGGSAALRRSVGAGVFSRGAGGVGLGNGPTGGISAFTSTPLFGTSDQDRYKSAGYGMSATTDAGLQTRLAQISSISSAANEPVSGKYVALGKQSPKWLQDAYASGAISGQGEDRIESFGKMIEKNGTPEQQRAWGEAKTPQEKARILSGMSEGAGVGKQGANFGVPALTNSLFGRGMSEGQRLDALSSSFYGGGGSAAGAALGGGLAAAGASVIPIFGSLLSPLAGMMGSKLGGRLGDTNRGRDRATAGFLMSDEALSMGKGLIEGNEDVRSKINTEISDIRGRVERGEASDADKGRMEGMRGILAAGEYQKLITAAGGDPSKVDPKALEAAAKSQGMSADEFKTRAQTVGAAFSHKEEVAWRSIARAQGSISDKELKGLQGAGVATFDDGKISLSDAAKKGLGAVKGGEDLTRMLLQATQMEAQGGGMAETGSVGDISAKFSGAADLRAGYMEKISSMTVEEQRNLAKSQIGAGFSGAGQTTLFAAAQQQRLKSLTKGGKTSQGIASFIGADVDADTMKMIQGAKSPEEKARLLASSIGLTDKDAVGGLTSAFKDLSKGGKGAGVGAFDLAKVTGSDQFKEIQQKRSMDKAKEENPLQDVMNKNLEEIKKGNEKQLEVLKAIGRNTGSTADEINKLDNKDPEKPPPSIAR